MTRERKPQFFSSLFGSSGASAISASSRKAIKEKVLHSWNERINARISAEEKLSQSALQKIAPAFLDEIFQSLFDVEAKEDSTNSSVGNSRDVLWSRELAATSYDILRLIDELDSLRKTVFDVLREHVEISDKTEDSILNLFSNELKVAIAQLENQKNLEPKIQNQTDSTHQELHDFIMQAPNAICVLSGSEHRFTFANPKFLELIGTNPVGLQVQEAFQSLDIQDKVQALDQVYKTGIPYFGHEIPIQTKQENGSTIERFVEVGFYPFRESDGSIKGIFAVVDDVTKHVQARKSVELSEKQFRELADSMPQIVWSAKPDGRIDYVNKKLTELTGLASEDMIGWGWDKIIHPEDFDRVVQNWTSSLQTGKDFTLNCRLKKSDGTYRWHLVRAIPIRNEKNQIVRWYGTDTDIHDFISLKEQLDVARLQAEAANATKSSFLANMSHEIRTPMTAVLGFTELLREPLLSDYERQEAITRIERSGKSLLRVLDDVLDISKIEAGKLSIQKSHFSPIAVVSDVVALLRLSAEQKGVSVRFKADASVPAKAFSDPARIRQILINLVGNAVKFTAQGEVVLSVKAASTQTLVFEVSDTGIGIAEKDQRRLFQAFAQADESVTRKFGGTGLGLLLSRRLAEQLGGSLELMESSPGQGSRFALLIDAKPFEYVDDVKANASLERSRQFLAGKPKVLEGLRVLLAEDVPDNQILMDRYLQSAGAQVEIACNGEEAIQKAEHGDYDLVLMDIQMPKLDGIQTTKWLRSKGFKIPILALTAHALNEEVNRSLDAGCNAHLTKPITRDLLVKTISHHTNRTLQ